MLSFNLSYSTEQQHLCARLGLLHKHGALSGSRIKPQHYALVIREACGRIIIISADQKITNDNGHQRGGTRGHVSLQSARKNTHQHEGKKQQQCECRETSQVCSLWFDFTPEIRRDTRTHNIEELWDVFLHCTDKNCERQAVSTVGILCGRDLGFPENKTNKTDRKGHHLTQANIQMMRLGCTVFAPTVLKKQKWQQRQRAAAEATFGWRSQHQQGTTAR